MKKIAILAALLVLTSTVASASQLDKYRAMLDNRSCTIKYEVLLNTQESKKITSSDTEVLKSLAKEPSFTVKPANKTGLVVLDGNNSFVSYGSDTYRQENLVKNGYQYGFTKNVSGDKTTYFGKTGKVEKSIDNKEYVFVGKNKVKGESATSPTVFDKALYSNANLAGRLYGDDEMAAMLSVITPNVDFVGATKKYWLTASGSLSTGATYEDYQWANDAGEVDLMRFYFYQGDLKKIAAVHYKKIGPGKVKGEQYLIAINEFSSTPASEYVALPSGIKDVTKYEK